MPKYFETDPVKPVERWQKFGGRIEYDAEPVQRSIATIHAAHARRVAINTLEEDIQGFEKFLLSFGHQRIYL